MKESLPKIHRHRFMWGILSVLVMLAFFFVWTMGNHGTPAKTGTDPVPNYIDGQGAPPPASTTPAQ